MNYYSDTQTTPSPKLQRYNNEEEKKLRWHRHPLNISNPSVNNMACASPTAAANTYTSGTPTDYRMPLQEPVAFEDFQFSLGLDPDFAMPISLDMPPPPLPPALPTLPRHNTPSFASDDTNIDTQRVQFQPHRPPPRSPDHYDWPINNNTQQIPYHYPNDHLNNVILDEQEHKAFTEWLNHFFVDPDMEAAPAFAQQSLHQDRDQQQKEDTAARKPITTMNHANLSPCLVTTATNNSSIPDESSVCKRQHPSQMGSNDSHESKKGTNGSRRSKGTSSFGSFGGAIRRIHQKELLTEEEKRNNHIASEQKRRSMIRSGFKNLTEIVPTLSKIANNSKSTILMQSVDYIKYLERGNNKLREKVKQLEFRVKVENKTKMDIDLPIATTAKKDILPSEIHSTKPFTSPESVKETTVDSAVDINSQPMVADSTDSALKLHKYQQRQLLELQEKLHLHQQLLLQRNKEHNSEKDNKDNIVSV